LPRILLIAATTGYQTRSFAAAARHLHVDATLATDRCHILEDPWRDNAVAIRFEEPHQSAEILANLARTQNIAGIAAVADRPTLIAALTAAKLGLPWHPPEAAAACRDKHRMRQLFHAAGLPVPLYERISIHSEPAQAAARTSYPCVLKPLSLSASRGVIRANNRAEFIDAFNRIRRIVGTSSDAIQVEAYIPGREYALEGLMTQGQLRTLAVFDKPDPLEGPFFEETLYITPSREMASFVRALIDSTTRAARSLGLWHGPIHAEMRANHTGIYMLEIAARSIGGLCSRAVKFNVGQALPPVRSISLEQLLVLHAIGQAPAHLEPATPAAGVMMIPIPREGIFESVEGLDDARAFPGIDDVVITAKRGEHLIPLPEGAGYFGFVFSSGENPAFVEDALRRAHRKLRFRITPAFKVIA